jgi:hypothetical protein
MMASYSGFLGYTDISREEFEQVFAAVRPALIPSCFILVYDESGQPAGFAGAILDLADALRAMQGRGGPIASARFLYHRRRADRLVFLHGGLTPRESTKRSGLGRAGFYYVIRQALDAGYARIVMALRAENSPSRGLLGKNVPRAQQEYALYELTR